MQDPLSELVKIDPKALGVGMYQHDVNQGALAEELARVVEGAVNAVGVDVNQASPSLLAHVAGLTRRTSKSIIAAREASPGGRFASVAEVRAVKASGQAFEQAAGFLRIFGGSEPLDATDVHPRASEMCGAPCRSSTEEAREGRGKGNGKERETETETEQENEEGNTERGKRRAGSPGACTSARRDRRGGSRGGHGGRDAAGRLKALRRGPRYDPRDDLLSAAPASERHGSAQPTRRGGNGGGNGGAGQQRQQQQQQQQQGRRMTLADLSVGTELQGTIKNVVDFGAFVDLGIGADGAASPVPRAPAARAARRSGREGAVPAHHRGDTGRPQAKGPHQPRAGVAVRSSCARTWGAGQPARAVMAAR